MMHQNLISNLKMLLYVGQYDLVIIYFNRTLNHGSDFKF